MMCSTSREAFDPRPLIVSTMSPFLKARDGGGARRVDRVDRAAWHTACRSPSRTGEDGDGQQEIGERTGATMAARGAMLSVEETAPPLRRRSLPRRPPHGRRTPLRSRRRRTSHSRRAGRPTLFHRVPWRLSKPSSSGPNPMENVRTRTPYQRATRKWPNSWKNTTIVNTNKKGMTSPDASPDSALAPHTS